MTRPEMEQLLREHFAEVRGEISGLLRGVEKALDGHLAKAEEAIIAALADHDRELEERFERIETRIAAIEAAE